MEEDGGSELSTQVREERSMERESPVRLEESTYMFQMIIIKMLKFDYLLLVQGMIIVLVTCQAISGFSRILLTPYSYHLVPYGT